MGNYLCCCDKPENSEISYAPIPLKSTFPAVQRGTCNIYDLHGKSEMNAMRKVKQVLREKEKEVRGACGDIYVEFITGRGKHSKNHIPVIRKAVTRYLKSQSYDWKYGDMYRGSVVVRIPFQD